MKYDYQTACKMVEEALEHGATWNMAVAFTQETDGDLVKQIVAEQYEQARKGVDFLKTHINNMLEYYRLHDCFNSEDLDLLMELADFTDFEISKLINKFHYINTRIADNGGVPVLKQILQLL